MQAVKDVRNNYMVNTVIDIPEAKRIVEICTHKVSNGLFVCDVKGLTIEGNMKVWAYGKDYSKKLRQERFRGTAKAVEEFHAYAIEQAGGKVAILKDVEAWYSVAREAQPVIVGGVA